MSAALAANVRVAVKARSLRDAAVVAFGLILGLPTLGTFGLIDPWETHYAEVAREMIARGDFISPWWANEGFFKTKPVLLFWLEAIFMELLGTSTSADHVLEHAQHPEWAVRLPGFLLALAGAHVLYLGVARVYGRRAARFGALVLWTMPGFALLSRQAITDVPLVAGIAASMGFSLLALHTDDAVETRAGPYAAAAIAAALVPQLLVVAFQGRLSAGDPATCTLPGHPACTAMAFAHPRLTPILQTSLWFVPTCALVLNAWDEKRRTRLFALGAWGAAALATMAKGPAGLAIPAAFVAAHLLARRSLRDIVRDLGRFDVAVGLLLVVTMVGPWYLALYARHGRAFLNELVGRNMLGRALEHLHDTNDGDDVGIAYFVRQLGYATFPWAGVALAGVFSLGRERGRRLVVRTALSGAAMLAFGLVSMMQTKFHHYGLIALPAIAVLAGIELARPRRRLLVLAAVVTAIVGRDLAAAPASFVKLFTYRYTRLWPSTQAFPTFFVVVTVAMIVALGVVAVRPRLRAVAFAPAVVLAFALVNVYLPRCAHDGGQRALFERYYAATDRQGPLLAYQLNWKGENFYSGDHTAIFISTGAPFRKWLDERRAKDQRVVYAITERGRARGLRAELGATSFEELVPPESCAEYTLVRAELAR